jgi:hypothetical protein
VIDPREPVPSALQRYFARFRLDRAGYAAKAFVVPLGPLRLTFPNPGRLFEHDHHHVALDLPADFWGEVEISAFELRTGVPNAIIGLLCVGSLLLGALVRPRAVYRAWKRHPRARNLYREAPSREALASMDVGQLRAWMRLD